MGHGGQSLGEDLFLVCNDSGSYKVIGILEMAPAGDFSTDFFFHT